MSNNLKEIYNKVKNKKQKKNKLIFGPLNKTEETILFEEIIKDLIIDQEQESAKLYEQLNKTHEKVAIPKNHAPFDPDYKQKIFFNVKDDQLFIIRNDVEVNLSELMKKVNFNHVIVDAHDLTIYENLYQNNSYIDRYPKVPSKIVFEESIKKVDLIQQEALKDLTYAERLAINYYTYIDYAEMNGVLRGSSISPDIHTTLMNITIASQGLNKIPDIKLPTVVRYEKNVNNILENKIAMVKENNVESSLAFISTSHIPLQELGNIQIIYENVRGKNISALSHFPEEEEYLIPPSTQIKYTGHKMIDGKHVFTAEGVNALIYEKTPEDIAKNEITLLIDSTLKKISSESISEIELYDFNKNVAQIIFNNGLISEKVYQKYIDTNNDKLINSNNIKEILAYPNLTKKDQLIASVYKLCDTIGLKSIGEKLNNKLSVEAKEIMKLDNNLYTILKEVKGVKKEQKKQNFVEKLEFCRKNPIGHGEETSIK